MGRVWRPVDSLKFISVTDNGTFQPLLVKLSKTTAGTLKAAGRA